MGWIRRIHKSHQCAFPDNTQYQAGSIWECDICGKRWNLTYMNLGEPPVWVNDAQEQGEYYYSGP